MGALPVYAPAGPSSVAGPSPQPQADLPLLPGQLGPGSGLDSSQVPGQAPSGSRLAVVLSRSVSESVLHSVFARVPGLLSCDLRRDSRTGQSRVGTPPSASVWVHAL